jgi:hypothetical protein
MLIYWEKRNTINDNTEALLDTSREVDLEEKTEKTKYMFMSCHQTAGQNHHIKVANKSSEVANFKYLGTVVTNQNSIHEEIKFWEYLPTKQFVSSAFLSAT